MLEEERERRTVLEWVRQSWWKVAITVAASLAVVAGFMAIWYVFVTAMLNIFLDGVTP